jgi:hypothetical protein
VIAGIAGITGATTADGSLKAKRRTSARLGNQLSLSRTMLLGGEPSKRDADGPAAAILLRGKAFSPSEDDPLQTAESTFMEWESSPGDDPTSASSALSAAGSAGRFRTFSGAPGARWSLSGGWEN